MPNYTRKWNDSSLKKCLKRKEVGNKKGSLSVKDLEAVMVIVL